jgi:hypothetical protein
MSRRKSGRRLNSLQDNDISIWKIPEEANMEADRRHPWSPGSSDIHDLLIENSNDYFPSKEDDYKSRSEDDHPSILAHIETASIDISAREAYAEVSGIFNGRVIFRN